MQCSTRSKAKTPALLCSTPHSQQYQLLSLHAQHADKSGMQRCLRMQYGQHVKHSASLRSCLSQMCGMRYAVLSAPDQMTKWKCSGGMLQNGPEELDVMLVQSRLSAAPCSWLNSLHLDIMHASAPCEAVLAHVLPGA